MGETIGLTLKQRAIEQAVAHFQKQRATLYRPDGTPKFSLAELAEQQQAVLLPLRQAVNEALAEAEQAEAEALRLESMRNADPLAALPAADLAQAAALRPFIQDFCEADPLPDLAHRLVAVVAHGSVAEKVLYARYAARRHDATIERLQAGKVRLDAGEGEALRAIAQSSAALRSAITPKAAVAALSQAATLRHRAGELRTYARDALSKADGSDERHRAEIADHYRQIF